VGWSLLISGILIQHFFTPSSNIPVLIAGQLHGTIFLIYLVAVILLYSSLRWSRKRTLIAGLASIPPYGSLVFEQWAAYKRRGEALKTYREVVAYALIIKGTTVLALQSKDSAYWQLPGGLVQAKQTVEQGLQRLVRAQTGVAPVLGRLAYLRQSRSKSTERLELFFVISNYSDYREQALKKLQTSKEIDDIRFIKPAGNRGLRPAFLQREPITALSKKQAGEVKFITS
jgi:integral membrane protein